MKVKKRRSRINREEYQFIYPDDIELLVRNGEDDKIEAIAESVYDFYKEGIVGFTPTLPEFKRLYMSFKRGYIAKKEISFYYYMKYALEIHYNMYNHRSYFSEMIEEAFRKYLREENHSIKEAIYNKFLYNAFSKLIENIINTYKLRSHVLSYPDQHSSTLSFVHEKIKKFKPDFNKKAYSYFGTIIKRFWINERKEETKKNKRVDSFDVYQSHILDDVQFSYIEKDSEENWNVEFFYQLQEILNNYMYLSGKIDFLTDKDLEVGRAIIEIIGNWEKIFTDLGTTHNTTNSFQKKYVFHILRNYTGLTTAEISRSLKVYKQAYKRWKNEFVVEKYNPFDDFN
jgi:hypothetical protein